MKERNNKVLIVLEHRDEAEHQLLAVPVLHLDLFDKVSTKSEGFDLGCGDRQTNYVG